MFQTSHFLFGGAQSSVVHVVLNDIRIWVYLMYIHSLDFAIAKVNFKCVKHGRL